MDPTTFQNGSDAEDYTGISSDMDDEMSWVDWFLSTDGNEVFVEVDEDYIRDSFNLTGLSSCVKNFDRALAIILDEEDENDFDDNFDDEQDDNDSHMFPSSAAMAAAQTLYGLIHARYIVMHKGIAAMLEKYNAYVYGMCPNSCCKNQPVVPIGMSDQLGVSTANVFCPRCNEVYFPRNPRLATVDGAFFGTTFPHLFFLHYDHLINSGPVQYYVPKLHGFTVWRGVRDMLRDEASKLSGRRGGGFRSSAARTAALMGNKKDEDKEKPQAKQPSLPSTRSYKECISMTIDMSVRKRD